MPRNAREIKPGIYHVLIQGKRQSMLFTDSDVKQLYWNQLFVACRNCSIYIHAYCFLENSAHFVLEDIHGNLGNCMRTTHAAFSKEMKHRYPSHSGSWFRDRYRSRQLPQEWDLVQAVRYVHQKPVLDGLAESVEDYKWSSYQLYELRKTEMIKTMQVIDALHFAGGYKDFMRERIPDTRLFLKEMPETYGQSDEEAKAIVVSYLNADGFERFFMLSEEEQRDILRLIRRKGEVSIMKLSHITGISRGIIQRL